MARVGHLLFSDTPSLCYHYVGIMWVTPLARNRLWSRLAARMVPSIRRPSSKSRSIVIVIPSARPVTDNATAAPSLLYRSGVTRDIARDRTASRHKSNYMRMGAKLDQTLRILDVEGDVANARPVRDEARSLLSVERHIADRKVDKLFTFPEARGRADRGRGWSPDLTSSKTLVEAMHGSIGVESTAGQGSTFWVALAIVGTRRSKLRRCLQACSPGRRGR